MTQIGWALATGLLHLLFVAAVVGPLIWWRARRRGMTAVGPGGWRTITFAAAIYLGAVVVIRLPRFGFFAELAWNWQNKLLLVLLLAALVSLWPTMTWRDVGIRRPRRGWWIPVVGITLGAFALQLLVGVFADFTPDPETIAFQALMPGLDEELLFRGILLFLLDRALRARRSMWRADVGWSALISCLLFGLGHGLALQEGFTVIFTPASVIITGLIGALLLWVRIRWDSLWPAILAHNGWNSSAVAANAFME